MGWEKINTDPCCGRCKRGQREQHMKQKQKTEGVQGNCQKNIYEIKNMRKPLLHMYINSLGINYFKGQHNEVANAPC